MEIRKFSARLARDHPAAETLPRSADFTLRYCTVVIDQKGKKEFSTAGYPSRS
jgi:hypothetical protein